MYKLVKYALRDRRVQLTLYILFLLCAFWFGGLALLESSPSIGVRTSAEIVSRGRDCSYNKETGITDCTDYTIVRFVDQWNQVQQMRTAGYYDSAQVRYLPVPFFSTWFAIVEPDTPVMVVFIGFMAFVLLIFGVLGILTWFVPAIGNLNWAKMLDKPAVGYAFFGLLLIVCGLSIGFDWLQKTQAITQVFAFLSIFFVPGLILLCAPLWYDKVRFWF